MANMNIRKGDTVKVIAGKDKGVEGKVLGTIPHSQRVLVERVAMVKKATRPTQKNPKGGLIEMEAPIHVSNVMLMCEKCKAPTRVSRTRVDGKRVRHCKRCDAKLD